MPKFYRMNNNLINSRFIVRIVDETEKMRTLSKTVVGFDRTATEKLAKGERYFKVYLEDKTTLLVAQSDLDGSLFEKFSLTDGYVL
jgi:Mg2+ and Co2+ transporter CorA